MNLFALVNGAPWIFGPVTFAGTITFTGSALLADGSAAAPALAFAADTDTGIFRPGTHEIAFATGGTERASFISQGLKLSNVGGSFTVPNVFANGDQDTGLAVIGGNRLALVVGGATGLCFNASGNVLIGTTTDSGNGRLQLATHTTSAGGIGFGSDTSLFRTESGNLGLYGTGTSSKITFSHSTTTAGKGFDVECDSAKDGYVWNRENRNIFFGTNNTLALTLDSSQNATFAGQAVSSVNASTVTNLGNFVASNATLNAFVSYTSGASADQKYWSWQSGSAVGDGVFRLRALNDAGTNGKNAIVVKRTGISSVIVNLPSLPTSSASLAAGDLWNDSGTVKVV